MKIIWSPLALERVTEIARYIAQDNPDAARRWVNDLFETVKRLREHPLSGRVVPEVGLPRIREVIFGAYRVIYGVKKRQIDVLTVRHGSQLLRREDIEEQN